MCMVGGVESHALLLELKYAPGCKWAQQQLCLLVWDGDVLTQPSERAWVLGVLLVDLWVAATLAGGWPTLL